MTHVPRKKLLVLLCCSISLQAAAFEQVDLTRLLDSGNCDHCDLSDSDLRGRRFAGASLAGSNLSGADLSGCNLRYANLIGVDLTQAKLSGADLSGARLQGARLYGVDLSETRLAGADMRDVDLSHMDIDLALEFLDLTGVLLEGAQFKDGVRCAGLPEKGGWGCAAIP
jgi:uncharacterized protein YjbI with pentapeptide repeats